MNLSDLSDVASATNEMDYSESDAAASEQDNRFDASESAAADAFAHQAQADNGNTVSANHPSSNDPMSEEMLSEDLGHPALPSLKISRKILLKAAVRAKPKPTFKKAASTENKHKVAKAAKEARKAAEAAAVAVEPVATPAPIETPVAVAPPAPAKAPVAVANDVAAEPQASSLDATPNAVATPPAAVATPNVASTPTAAQTNAEAIVAETPAPIAPVEPSAVVATPPPAVEVAPAKAPVTETVPAPAASKAPAEPPAPKTPGVVNTFADLDLPRPIQDAITAAGYTKPSDIQASIIPPMLEGRDVIAQSQTGSGKTAAFALPVLANLRSGSRKAARSAGPSVLVLAPTRELAMQVAASFATYAGDLKDFAVTAIYGGQDYMPQKRALRDGVSVVVGTPGRVIDHIKQGSLKIDNLQCLVLDEADEMLNMGFLEDVEFVLDKCPDQRQIALFSATMPDPIRRIADRYLNNPKVVTIKSKSMTADSIRQRAIFCGAGEKTDLLCRVLEAETTDGIIVFAKTKESTTVIADKLVKAGHSACALNGDMPQATRQRVVANLKSGKLDIIVATDVAARGLDVPRISHVINFDLPHDRESYVHRIGRTGRAGRKGEAILFLAPSARHRLRSIAQMTKQEIEVVEWPSIEQINQKRIAGFNERITKCLADCDVTFFENLVQQYMEETGKPIEKVAAALALIGKGRGPFLLSERVKSKGRDRGERGNSRGDDRYQQEGRGDRGPRRAPGAVSSGMQRYRVEVGRIDGV